LLGRAGLTLDRRQKKVSSWWGLLIPFKTTDRNLAEVKHISITTEVRGGKNKSTHYVVKLAFPTDALEIEAPMDQRVARQLAERAAKFCGLGIVDSTSGDTVVREAGTLDESVTDRARRKGERVGFPAEIAGSRISYHLNGDTGAFALPKVGFQAAHLLGLVAGVGVFFFVGGFFLMPFLLTLHDANAPGFLPYVMMLFCLPVLGIPLFILGSVARSATTQERVLSSPKGVFVERSTCFGRSLVGVKGEELEELFVARTTGRSGKPSLLDSLMGKRIVARSDTTEVEFGAGLRPDEVEWLHQAVRYHLTAEPTV
jgi:hypothetical protein